MSNSINDIVNKFLAWRLPEDFHPDAGISFTPPSGYYNQPTGTNLFTANQAKAMIEFIAGERIAALEAEVARLDSLNCALDIKFNSTQQSLDQMDVLYDELKEAQRWIPICKKCKVKPCAYYGEIGGYSVQCKDCNAEASLKRRISYSKRKK